VKKKIINTNEQNLVTLTGYPYSGKTTLSKKLVEKYGYKYVSMDDVLNQENMIVEEMTQEDWNFVYSTAYDNLKNFLKEGFSVVIDCGNLLRSERETPKRIAESFGVSSYLIFIDIPEEEILRRFKENDEKKFRDQLELATLKRAIKMFQKPIEEENAIIIKDFNDLEFE